MNVGIALQTEGFEGLSFLCSRRGIGIGTRHIIYRVRARRAAGGIAVDDAIERIVSRQVEIDVCRANGIGCTTPHASTGIIVAFQVISSAGSRAEVIIVERGGRTIHRETLLVAQSRHEVASAIVEIHILPCRLLLTTRLIAATVGSWERDVKAITTGSRRARRTEVECTATAIGIDVEDATLYVDIPCCIDSAPTISRAIDSHVTATHRDIAFGLQGSTIAGVVNSSATRSCFADNVSATLCNLNASILHHDIRIALHSLHIAARASHGDVAACNRHEHVALQSRHVASRQSDIDGTAIDDELAIQFFAIQFGLGLDAIAGNVTHHNGAAIHLEILLGMNAIALCTSNSDGAGGLLHLHVFLRANGMFYIALHRECPTLAHFQMTFAEKGRLAC